LFSEFDTNYNDEPFLYKKGTILVRKRIRHPKNGKMCVVVLPLHEDLIQDAFWERHSEILAVKTAGSYEWPESRPLPPLVLSQLRIDVKDRDEEIVAVEETV
jgi:hypothetical protein